MVVTRFVLRLPPQSIKADQSKEQRYAHSEYRPVNSGITNTESARMNHLLTKIRERVKHCDRGELCGGFPCRRGKSMLLGDSKCLGEVHCPRLKLRPMIFCVGKLTDSGRADDSTSTNRTRIIR